MLSPETLETKIATLRYYSILAVAKALAPDGRLGFDPNRRFAGTGSKRRFAQWIMETYGADLTRVESAYEEAAGKDNPLQPTPRPSVPQVFNVPHPDAPHAPSVAEILAQVPASSAQRAADSDAARARAEQAKPAEAQPDAAKALADAIAAIMAGQRTSVDPEQVAEIARAIVADELAKHGRTIIVQHVDATNAPTAEPVNMGRQHVTFEKLLSRCQLRGADGKRLNIWLTGPAGSGKTTGAMNVAKALQLTFYHTGALDTEYKLLGFTDAQGRIVSTAFRQAWEHGGVFLFDEVDASLAGAIMALNAALANGHCAFPDGNMERHPDCVIIAAANTWGAGATFDYVGRNKLDAASLDRFVKLAWDYDEALERDTCGNVIWARKVQAWRERVRVNGMKHIISPRASYTGAAMLAAGIPEPDVVAEVVFAGLTSDQLRQVA